MKLKISLAVILIVLITFFIFKYGFVNNTNAFAKPASTKIMAKHVSFDDYRQLDEYFKKIGYTNFKKVPLVYVDHLPKNLNSAPTTKRKELFIKIMLPLIKKANNDLLTQRKIIETAIKQNNVETINKYLRLYKAKDKNDLLLRVDAIPIDLTIAQAAIESGWGTSRFAIDGNNIFGEWTFEQGKGIIPKQRPDGAKYSVKRFKTLLDSLNSYVYNLNTSPFYDDFRKARAGEIDKDPKLTLTAYSTKKEEYIKIIKRVIDVNNLSDLN